MLLTNIYWSVSTNIFQDFAVNYWLEKGVTKEKLLLGIAFYGRCFTLTSEETDLGAPADGPAPEGPFTREEGFYSYYEVNVKTSKTTVMIQHSVSSRQILNVKYNEYFISDMRC